jgi:hypothetical protein
MLPLDVPSGGFVSLKNVRLNRGQATPERIDVTFEAVVAADPVCDGEAGVIAVSDAEARNTFAVRLEGTAYESDAGCPDAPVCEDLHRQFKVKIDGTQSAQGITAERIRLVICRTPGRAGR